VRPNFKVFFSFFLHFKSLENIIFLKEQVALLKE
jgi:hypothetical protein